MNPTGQSPPAATVLHLEDSDLDAELVRDRLERAGLHVTIELVSNRRDFTARLQQQRYDLILSDYQVPSFTGMAALELSRVHQPDTPFVFISGTMGEEFAIETLKHGATDYVLKQGLARLPAAVERALAEARERAVRREAEERAKRELRTSETRLFFALKAGRMGTWDFEVEPLLLTSSDSCKASYGRQPHEPFTYADLAACILDEDRPRWRQLVEQTVARAGDFEIEYRVRWPSGEVHWVHVRGGCSLAAAGRALALSGVSFDITERKKSEEETARLYELVREQDKRKDEFLATLAHELRNPLAPVRHGLQILREVGSGEQGEKIREMMERQLGHMVRLIDDLMDVSRITRGRVELRKERMELRAVVDSALEVSRPLIEAAGHALAVRVPRGIFLEADPTRIAQVIENLLNNAAKYTPEGGRIALSAEREGQSVVLRVADTGVGIAAEMLPRVFDMFTQVGRTLERAQGGLGIGLTLVRRLVEMHGGTADVDSPGVGQGTTVTVRLPAAVSEEPVRARPPTGSEGPGVSPLRVLIVDDNIDGAESLAMLMQLSRHVTRVAHTGPDALTAAAAFRPDVIFLDIGLPGMDGYEVAKQLRAQAEFRSTVLVALTGWGSESDRRRSKDVGFDHHLTKPVDVAYIKKLLTGLAAAHG